MPKDFDVEQEREVEEGGNFWKQWGLLIILVEGSMFLFWRNTWEPVNLFYWYSIFFMSAIMILRGTLTWWRHISPKLIAPPLVTTTVGTPLAKAGNWLIYTMNDIATESIPIGEEGLVFRFKTGAIIVPESATNKIERNVVCLTYVVPTPLDDLPEEVIDQILYYKLKPPYYWGIADPSAYGTDVDREALKARGVVLTKEDMKQMGITDELNRPSVGFLVRQFKEALRDRNTYMRSAEEWRRQVENLRAAIRRLKDLEDHSAKELLSALVFKPEEEKR